MTLHETLNLMNVAKNHYGFLLFCLIGCVSSLICVLIHLYKFVNSPSKQKLPSKNLASYCLCSAMLYLFMFHRSSCFTGIFGFKAMLTWRLYLYMTSSLLLFNMSFDVYLCLRRSAKSCQLSKGARNKAFIIYTIFAWGSSALLTAVIYFAAGSDDNRFDVTVLITTLMRIVCLGLFFLSIYYIKSVNITNRNLRHHAFMHARLLLINGITSILWCLTLAMIVLFSAWNELLEVFLFFSIILYAYDGILIALFYTFKKSTFVGVDENPKVVSNSKMSSVMKNTNVDSTSEYSSCMANVDV